MKRLNQILQSSYLYCIIIAFSIIYVLFFTKVIIYNSKYTGNDNSIIGTITDKYNYENYTKYEIKGLEKVIVYYYGNDEHIKLGDKVKFYGNFEKPLNNTNFNQFNYKEYLYNNRIHYIFKASNCDLIRSNRNILYKIKNYLFNKVEKSTEKEYLSTFILGKNILDNQIKDMYRMLGVSHLMAISGMHVSFFISIILLALKKINIGNRITSIFIVFFLLFYMFIVGFSGSIVRCGTFFIVSEIIKLFNIDISIIKKYLLSIFIIVIINPFIVYNLGFIYSGTISLYLILFSNLINNKRNYFYKLFFVSVISFLASLPITLYNFYSINYLSILFNMICVPFVSFIIFPLSVVTLFLPFFSNLLGFFINAFEVICKFFSNFNSYLVFGKPTLLIFFSYYFFITLGLYKKGANRILYVLLFFVFVFFHYNYPLYCSFLNIIDVGQGDSFILHLNNKTFLIDTGGKKYNSSFSKNLISSTTVNILYSYGIERLNYLILSHGDYDHMGEAINLVNNFKVEKVIFNCGEFNDLEKKLIKVLEKKKIKYYSCIKELNVDYNKLYFLQTKEYDNENDNSNVIYTELNGYKFMFMGDAGIEKEKDILDKYNISNVDVLKVGHHGSKTSSGKEFINEISPKYSVISVGKNNRYGHPNKEVLNTLDNSKVYRTDQDGSIMFKIKNNKLKIEFCSP